MVKYICEKCLGEFADLPVAINHEATPIFGEGYNCSAAKNNEGRYLVFLEAGVSMNHERNYYSVEIENLETQIKKKLNGRYLFSEIEKKKQENYFLKIGEEEINELEGKIRKNMDCLEGKVRFFGQEFDCLKSI